MSVIKLMCRCYVAVIATCLFMSVCYGTSTESVGLPSSNTDTHLSQGPKSSMTDDSMPGNDGKANTLESYTGTSINLSDSFEVATNSLQTTSVEQQANMLATAQDLLIGENSENIKNAVQILLRLSEIGHHEAQLILGNLYIDATKVEANPQLAFDLFSQSANSGNSGAMRMLAYLYQNGTGVEKNMQQATDWYLRANEVDAARPVERRKPVKVKLSYVSYILAVALLVLIFLARQSYVKQKRYYQQKGLFEFVFNMNPLKAGVKASISRFSLISLFLGIAATTYFQVSFPGNALPFVVTLSSVFLAGVLLYWYLFMSRTVLLIPVRERDTDALWKTFSASSEQYFTDNRNWTLLGSTTKEISFVVDKSWGGFVTLRQEGMSLLVELSGFKLLDIVSIKKGSERVRQDIDMLYSEAIQAVKTERREKEEQQEHEAEQLLQSKIDHLASYIENLRQEDPVIYGTIQKIFDDNVLNVDINDVLSKQHVMELVDQFSQASMQGKKFDLFGWQPLKDMIDNEVKQLSERKNKLLKELETTYFYPCLINKIVSIREGLTKKEFESICIREGMSNAEMERCIDSIAWMIDNIHMANTYLSVTVKIKLMSDTIRDYMTLSESTLLNAFFSAEKLKNIRQMFYAMIDSDLSLVDLQIKLVSLERRLLEMPGFQQLTVKGKNALINAISALPKDHSLNVIEIAQRVHKSYGVAFNDRPDECGCKHISGLGNEAFAPMTFTEYQDWDKTRSYVQQILQLWINDNYPDQYGQLRAQLGSTTTIGEAELVKQDMENLKLIKQQCQQTIRDYINADARRKHEAHNQDKNPQQIFSLKHKNNKKNRKKQSVSQSVNATVSY